MGKQGGAFSLSQARRDTRHLCSQCIQLQGALEKWLFVHPMGYMSVHMASHFAVSGQFMIEFQLLKFVFSSSTWNYHQRWQWGKEQCTVHQVCGTGVSIRTQRFLLFSLSSEYPRNARWNYLFPGFWEEKNGPEGHLVLLMKALLLKSRVEVIRVGKGVRTSEQHQYWEDFIAKFPLPESW